MSQAPSVALAGSSEGRHAEGVADVTLRGTTRGLEIWIAGTPSAEAIGARLSELLAEAPGFFAGSQARVVIEGALPVGALACLEEVAARFELRLVEIGPPGAKRMRGELTPLPPLPPLPAIPPIPLAAEASAPVAPQADPGLMAALAAVLLAAGAREAEAVVAEDIVVVEEEAPGPRLVIGPVRSGRIVDHAGHLIVIGDVNPGAEVRAEGSIIVLGRLRGVAHAAIGRDAGCIIALSLQPQQLRIGRMVARAGDADRPGGGAEIAYATGETIVVERFVGRLPSGLAASM